MKHVSLSKKYKETVIPTLVEEFGIKNSYSVPKINKIVVNMGTGEELKRKEAKDRLMRDLSTITGQLPKIQPAKISVSGFGIREGMPVGLTVTLRRDRLYNFLDRFVSVVLPRFRDFKGVGRRSFDSAGNYTIGISDYSVFPEIDLGKTDKAHGVEITIVIKNGSKQRSLRLLELLGMPFEKVQN